MTKETYDESTELFGDIQILKARIDSYNKALSEQTSRTAYSRDEMNVRLYNGVVKPCGVIVPRRLVIDMLNSAIGKCQAEIDKLQAELDAI